MTPGHDRWNRPRTRSEASARHAFRFVDDGQYAVFPILKLSSTGDLALCGTGCFVAPGGVVLSARHVFEGNDVAPGDQFWILQSCAADSPVARRITQFVLHDELDLAVAELDNRPELGPAFDEHPTVGIMKLDPEIHEVVASFVYPHTLIQHTRVDASGEWIDVEHFIRLRSHWEVGLVVGVHPAGLRLVKGPCIESSVLVDGRASGGPLFNSNGFVIGVNSTGLDSGDDAAPLSTATSIREALALQIRGESLAKILEARGGVPRPIARRDTIPSSDKS